MSKNHFFSERYAVMRHAEDKGDRIPGPEQEICRQVTGQFAEQIPGLSVRIYHSFFPRAQLTAEIVAETLTSLGRKVTAVDGLGWLMHRIDDGKIADFLEAHPDDFILFIGHQPDVAEHAGVDKKKVKNCEVFAKDFSVRRPS